MNKKIIGKLGILALGACLIAGCQPQSAGPQNQKVQTSSKAAPPQPLEVVEDH